MLLMSSADFSQVNFFEKKLSQDSLDQDQNRRSVGPDQDPNRKL